MPEEISLFHISHTDLDGYGSQFITSKIFKNIHFYNTNYGNEIKEKFEKAISDIKRLSPINPTILITDVNLTAELSDYVNKTCLENDISLLLIDHHETGKNSAEKHSWYHLDSSKCATRLTYLHFKDLIKDEALNDFLNTTSSVINVYDMWNKNEPLFRKSTFISDAIFNDPLPNTVELHRTYRFYLIETLTTELIIQNKTIKQVELEMPLIIDKFLEQHLSELYFTEDNMSIIHKFYMIIFENMHQTEHDYFVLNNLKGLLFYDLGAGPFQYISDWCLEKMDDIDFTMHVKSSGVLSLRSVGETSVSKLAGKYFSGGGHQNASGGRLPFEPKSISDILSHLNSVEE